jgi:hypothetical protein
VGRALHVRELDAQRDRHSLFLGDLHRRLCGMCARHVLDARYHHRTYVVRVQDGRHRYQSYVAHELDDRQSLCADLQLLDHPE